MSAELVTGSVNFGPSAADDFYRSRAQSAEVELESLRAENARLIRHVNMLRDLVLRLAPLSNEMAAERYEVLQKTSAENR